MRNAAITALLPGRAMAKPWGMDRLPAPFAIFSGGGRVGELWFEPPPELDRLLVKYLFTSEKLSVQVHPSDEQTLAAGLGRQGKDECWLVVRAEPNARIGVGLRREMDPAALREAALDGSIEELLDWHRVDAGDFLYIPANTIHAIGGGLCILEIQQNSDITYRLYDYGRPRELHVDAAVRVARGAPYDRRHHRRHATQTTQSLVEGPSFRLHNIRGAPPADIASQYRGPLLVIPIEGQAAIGAQVVGPGQCALAQSISAIAFPADGACLIAQPIAI